MNKKEIEKEAEESSKKAFCVAHTHEDELIFKNGYLAGAEPREKRIEELEETIDKLREQFALRYDLEDKIEILREENAELKEKARELLNACICKARGNVNPSWSELITDIEQFLREIEK